MPTLMPEQASTWAPQVDFINDVILYISLFCIVVITIVMLYFATKYRRKTENDATEYILGNHTLEAVWTIIPTVICVYIFYIGFDAYAEMRTPPPNAREIGVQAFQWRWEFEHPNGKKATNELVVPVDEPVRLVMRSQDVLHSFYVPAMRIKEDVVGSKYTYTWFHPVKTGEYHIFCTEYCGLDHSYMRAKLKVVSPEEYRDYIVDRGVVKEDIPPAKLGEKLYTLKGCNACHSLNGTKGVGPSFQGLWGRTEKLSDGSEVQVDENYLEESILYPNKKIVAGFAPAMPAFEGQLDDEQLKGLIAFIKELK